MASKYVTPMALAIGLCLPVGWLQAAAPSGSALTADAPAAVAAAAAPAAEEPLYQMSSSWEDYCARFGYWGVITSGSTKKVGEYQGLASSSPFWSFDGLYSNGQKTLDMSLNGTEDEATKAHLRYYGGPSLNADINYDRFIHQLDNSNPAGFNPTSKSLLSTNPSSSNTNALWSDDFSNGTDYAVRVQELKANFKGTINDVFKWRLNVFNLQKDGVREANALSHCYTAKLTIQGSTLTPASRCHLVDNAQTIHWNTTEVEPVLEMHLSDDLTVEYSRTMRQFTAADQNITNDYTAGSNTIAFHDILQSGYPVVGTNVNNPLRLPYAYVPNSYTEMDRLKLNYKLREETELYSLGYIGNSTDQYLGTNRHYGGADLRLTDTSINHVQLNVIAKVYSEHTGDTPLDSLKTLQFYPLQNGQPYFPEPMVTDRDETTFGVNSRWRPWEEEAGTYRSRLALTDGYEYKQMNRNPGSYELDNNTYYAVPPSTSNSFFVGAEEKWSKAFCTSVKYKLINTDYPLYGVTPGLVSGLDSALNSNLPTHEDRIELNATMTPADNFMLSATFYIECLLNDSAYAKFTENNYPFILSAWYGVNDRLSINGGYAQLTNWISQDITLGGANGQVPNSPPGATSRWNYGGESDVFNIGTSYVATRRLTLKGDFEYVHGANGFIAPTPSTAANGTAAYSSGTYALGQYSQVEVNTYKVGAGFDYLWGRGVSNFFRYNYYDYHDLAAVTGGSGQAHMLLGGVTAKY